MSDPISINTANLGNIRRPRAQAPKGTPSSSTTVNIPIGQNNSEELLKKLDITEEQLQEILKLHNDFHSLSYENQRQIVKEYKQTIINTTISNAIKQYSNLDEIALKTKFSQANTDEKLLIVAMETAKNKYIYSNNGSADKWNTLNEQEKISLIKKEFDSIKGIFENDKIISDINKNDKLDELFLRVQTANELQNNIDNLPSRKNPGSTQKPQTGLTRDKLIDARYDYLCRIIDAEDSHDFLSKLYSSPLVSDADKRLVAPYTIKLAALTHYIENCGEENLKKKFENANPCPSDIDEFYKEIDRSPLSLNLEYLEYLEEQAKAGGRELTDEELRELDTLRELKPYIVDQADETKKTDAEVGEALTLLDSIKESDDYKNAKKFEDKINIIINTFDSTFGDKKPEERARLFSAIITELAQTLGAHLALRLHRAYVEKHGEEYTQYISSREGTNIDATFDSHDIGTKAYNAEQSENLTTAYVEGGHEGQIRAVTYGVGQREDAPDIFRGVNKRVAESEVVSNEARQAYAQYSVEYSQPDFRQAQMDDLKTYNNEYFNKGAETGYQNAIQNERANNTQNSHETVPTQNTVETKTYSTDVISSSSVTVSPAEQKQVRQATRQIEHEIDQNTMLAAQDKEQLKREARKVGGDPQKLVAFISTHGQKFSKILGKMPSVTRRNIIKTFCKSADRAQILNFLKQNPSFADDIIGAGGYKIKGDVSAFLILNKQHTAPLSQNLIALGLTPKQVLPSVEKGSDMYMNLLALSQKDPKTEEQTRNEPPVYNYPPRQHKPSFERKF